MVQELKKTKANSIKDTISVKKNIIFTDYRGLTVEQITDLRNQLRDVGAEYHVYKNTLLSRVLKELDINIEDSILKGPTAVCISDSDDIVAPAKVISKFSKANDKLSFKAAYLEERSYDAAEFQQLADLPSREELIARIIGGVKQPITRVHSLITGPIRKIVYAIRAIENKQNA